MLSLEAKVGAFVLAGLVLIASAIFLLGDYTFERRYTIYATFADVANLSKDAPVKLSGVEVGKVKGLLLEDHHAKAIADFCGLPARARDRVTEPAKVPARN